MKNFCLKCSEEKRNNRSEGWAKIHSLREGAAGAINIQWDLNTKTLTARVITKSNNYPSKIIGDFTEYIFNKYGKVIKAVSIYPVD